MSHSLSTNSFYFNPTDQREITETISQLKNCSPGHDNIDASIMKSFKSDISYPLVHIFNQSFIHGIVPDQMKIAKVIPIHKKGDHSNFGNYRPISLLPAFSKILEKLVYNRMISFLDQNSILSDSQYGFRKGRSADLAILNRLKKFMNLLKRMNF